MSRPRYSWYGIVVRIVRRYPELCRLRDAAQGARITASYSAVPRGGGGAQRTTENNALRQLSPADQRELDAIEKTIEFFKARPDGEITLKIVELMDFKRSHTVEGAAYAVHVSPSVAKRKRGQFLNCVALKLGYEKN